MTDTVLKNNLILSTLYQGFSLLIPFITAPYVSRVLGVEGIGIYSYTQSYSVYFTLFAALGTVTYGTREIARHRDNELERSQIFWEITCLTFLLSTISIVLWGMWIFLNKEYQIYYLALTFSLLGTMFDISWFYAGLEKFKYTILHNCIFKLLGTILIFVFVNTKEDLFIYILILSLTVFLANFSMWIFLPQFVKIVPIYSLQLKNHLKETLIYFIPTIAVSVYTIFDKTLIGLITNSASENGNYEQATKIINLAKTLTFSGLNLVMQSRLSYLFANGKIEEIKERIVVSMDYIMFIGFGFCFSIIGIAPCFVPLFFGEGYSKTVILLQMLSPLVIVIGISNCLGSQYFNPAGLRRRSARFIIIGSIVNLALNMCFIPVIGSVGAVISTIIAEIIISFLYLINSDGFYSFSKLFEQSIKKLMAGSLMFLLISLFGNIVTNELISVIIKIIISFISYVLFLCLLKDSFVISICIPLLKSFINLRGR